MPGISAAVSCEKPSGYLCRRTQNTSSVYKKKPERSIVPDKIFSKFIQENAFVLLFFREFHNKRRHNADFIYS